MSANSEKLPTPELSGRELAESELQEVRGGTGYDSYVRGRNTSRGAKRTYSGNTSHSSDSSDKPPFWPNQ